VAARGVIACGDQGLDGVNYVLETDHNASDVNPQCVGGAIEPPEKPHAGVCNLVPLSPEFSGSGPRGSALLETGLAIALFNDAGRCCQAGVDPDCDDPFFEKGADGIPCNEDDFLLGDITRVFLTTGRARTTILDADNRPDERIAVGSEGACSRSDECPQADEVCVDLDTQGVCAVDSARCSCRVTCGSRLCVAENTGSPFDCDALAANGTDRFAGGALVSASVLFDSIVGDNAITSTLVDISTRIPTRTHTPSSTGTPTQTPTNPPEDTPTETPTEIAPTQTQTPGPVCTGDCDGDGSVTVDEIVTAVNIALGATPLTACLAADSDGSTTVTVDELVSAVNAALNGC
jgi:hypothetical protein